MTSFDNTGQTFEYELFSSMSELSDIHRDLTDTLQLLLKSSERKSSKEFSLASEFLGTHSDPLDSSRDRYQN
jgi:hypothetical protein